MSVHLLIVSIGTSTVDQLRSSQSRRLIAGDLCHVAKLRPTREAELLDGGSVFWIIRGHIAARQRVTALERLFDHEGEKCGVILDPELIETELFSRNPHQGWRYLEDEDAPRDLRDIVQDVTDDAEGEGELTEEMAAELRTLGLL
ncbi:MAG: lysophospholipase [Sneathiella sp.]|nr:MAG: lysophospholipase [Sneathiella sp.]